MRRQRTLKLCFKKRKICLATKTRSDVGNQFLGDKKLQEGSHNQKHQTRKDREKRPLCASTSLFWNCLYTPWENTTLETLRKLLVSAAVSIENLPSGCFSIKYLFFFYRIYWFPNLVSIYLISKLCSHFYILPTSTELKVTVNSTTIATYSQKGRVSVRTATCKRNTVTTEVTNFQFILPTPFINPNTRFVITVHSS